MGYQYVIEFLAEDGRALGRRVVTPDWGPALAWTRFEGIREGRLPPVLATVPGGVEPVWDGRTGEPYVAAFRVAIPAGGAGEVSREIPKAYLRSLVQQASAGLVAEGVLQAGEVFRYVLSAYPASPAGSPAEPEVEGFQVEEVTQPLPLDDAPLPAFLAGAGTVTDGESGGLPVFLPQRVLDEAMALARAAGDVETGGVLVGKLHRDCAPSDGGVPEIFVEITAQIPAPHTRSQANKLTFTADTWAAVHAALALRRLDELMLGWWHLHPDFCRLRGCPPERRARCTAASPFFSAEDVHLHATCFPSAYQIALLISDSTATGLTWSAFGWRQGMVSARPVHVLRTHEGGSTHARHAAAGS